MMAIGVVALEIRGAREAYGLSDVESLDADASIAALSVALADETRRCAWKL